jgi:hypothetical protein
LLLLNLGRMDLGRIYCESKLDLIHSNLVEHYVQQTADKNIHFKTSNNSQLRNVLPKYEIGHVLDSIVWSKSDSAKIYAAIIHSAKYIYT